MLFCLDENLRLPVGNSGCDYLSQAVCLPCIVGHLKNTTISPPFCPFCKQEFISLALKTLPALNTVYDRVKSLRPRINVCKQILQAQLLTLNKELFK